VPQHTLVPVLSGPSFQIVSPPRNALVTKELAEELHRVLERFGRIANASKSTRVTIFFKPGIFGHHRVGRAVDIYGVGGVGIDLWKRSWDDANRHAANAIDPVKRTTILKLERRQNLGWQLYKALQVFGGWSQPHGYPIQLFGPWTRTEGPWTYISDFLLRAHRDHIHVAR
jgi:hypothetical protein